MKQIFSTIYSIFFVFLLGYSLISIKSHAVFDRKEYNNLVSRVAPEPHQPNDKVLLTLMIASKLFESDDTAVKKAETVCEELETQGEDAMLALSDYKDKELQNPDAKIMAVNIMSNTLFDASLSRSELSFHDVLETIDFDKQMISHNIKASDEIITNMKDIKDKVRGANVDIDIRNGLIELGARKIEELSGKNK